MESKVQFINGSWYGHNGDKIRLSHDEEYEIIQKISRMESKAYSDVMPEFVMLDEVESLDDIIDYLDCRRNDAFIWYSDNGPLYFLASVQKIRYGIMKSVNVVEIADMNGKMTRDNISVIDDFIHWISIKNVQCVYCDARESTSNRILNGNAMKRRLKEIGFVDMESIDGLVFEDENMIPRVFVKKSWFDGLSDGDIQKLKSIIEDNFMYESKDDINEAFNVRPEEIDQNDSLDQSVYKQCKKISSGGNPTGTIIWNLYKKDKNNLDRDELDNIYGDQFKEILDRFDQYWKYVDLMKTDSFKIGSFTFKIKNNDGLMKLKSIKGLQVVLETMYELMSSSGEEDSSFDTQYEMSETDKESIRYLGSTENLICFVTQDFEPTNKFIYGIWRNPNMNSPYGHPEENSPFCTRMQNHWEGYSNGNVDYEQFWIFLKPSHSIPSESGDLNDANVMKLYKSMSHKGNDLLVGLLDTYNDCNTRDDKTTRFPTLNFFDKSGKDRTEEVVSMMDKLFFTESIEVRRISSGKSGFNYTETCLRMAQDAEQEYLKKIKDPSYVVDKEHARYLKTITIPDGVTSIGIRAFDKYSIKEIIVSEESPIYDKLREEYGDLVKSKEHMELNECQEFWINRYCLQPNCQER